MRFFKGFLEFIRWALISLTVVAIVIVISVAIKSPSFHDQLLDDLITFTGFFQPFSILLASTFVVVAVGYLLSQMSVLKETSQNLVENSERTRWIALITHHLDAMNDYYDMQTDILKKLPKIQEHLFKTKYVIRSKKELSDVFDSFFRSKVKKYEQNNVFCSKIKYYPDENYSYSFPNFRSVFILMIDDEKSYGELDEDLKNLYIEEVRLFSEDLVDREEYLKATSAAGESVLKKISVNR